MANENVAEDLDLGEEKPGKSKLIIIVAAVITLLLLGGGAAAYFLLFSGEKTPAGDVATEQATAEEATTKAPVQYLALDPPFVVTLPGKPKLLQVGISVSFRGDKLGEFVTHNDPMIRNSLLNLLSTVDANALRERAAKVALQKKMLDDVNRILKQLRAQGQVDALYFTSFVMQ
jgi:flagellar protein FliL